MQYSCAPGPHGVVPLRVLGGGGGGMPDSTMHFTSKPVWTCPEMKWTECVCVGGGGGSQKRSESAGWCFWAHVPV